MRGFGWWSVACALLLCSRALALDLSWSAPSECLDARAMAQRVAALQARYGRADPGAAATGRIVAHGEVYRLSLTVRVGGESLSREVESRACLTACEAAVWLLAMAGATDTRPAPGAAISASPAPSTRAAKPVRETQEPPARSSSDSEPSLPTAENALRTPSEGAGATRHDSAAAEGADMLEPPSARTDSRPSNKDQPVEGEHETRSAPTHQRRRARPPAWGRAALFAGVWGNDLPAPAAIVGARVGLGRGIVYGELRGALVLPREEQLNGPGAVRVSGQRVGLSGCGQWGARVRFGPCLRVTGQRSVGTTDIGSGPREDELFSVSLGPSALLGVSLVGVLELTAEAGFELPLSARPRFSIEGLGPVASASFLAGFAQIGLGVRWP